MLDSAAPKGDVGKYMANETRFRVVKQQKPERYRHLLELAQHEVTTRFGIYEQLAKLSVPNGQSGTARPTDK
jgi:pyruvate-ferredoxin/flavodoxin oxidoreductase